MPTHSETLKRMFRKRQNLREAGNSRILPEVPTLLTRQLQFQTNKEGHLSFIRVRTASTLKQILDEENLVNARNVVFPTSGDDVAERTLPVFDVVYCSPLMMSRHTRSRHQYQYRQQVGHVGSLWPPRGGNRQRNWIHQDGLRRKRGAAVHRAHCGRLQGHEGNVPENED